MSQRNETTQLVLALIITLGILGLSFWWFINRPEVRQRVENVTTETSQSVQSRISFGEKTLIGKVTPVKRAGVEAIATSTYDAAIANLEAALRVNRNDPEALIFLNNARIGSAKSYMIAVSVPIGSDPNGSLEILRGVAQAQNEINTAGGINKIPLKVAIANDDNNPEIAQQIASTFAKNPAVLGVVGPYASDVTLSAGKVYNSEKLVAISPISTSVKLSGFSPYILRTVPSDYVAARALANYMLTKLQRQNAVVFFSSQSAYSQSLKSEFVTAVSLTGGQVTNEFDLSLSDFSAAKSVVEAVQSAQVIMLAANTGTLNEALQVVQVNRKRLDILGGDDVYTPKTLEVGQDASVGMVVAVPWHIDANLKSHFSRGSRLLWGADVNWRTALSYDATRAFIAALAREPTRAGVQQALLSPNFSTTGASGTIRFLPSGDRNAPVQLVKIVSRQPSRSGTGYDFVPISQ